jgi:hypothetical protein
MTESTHAVLATFAMDLDRESEQRDALLGFIVPGVRSAPGFVSGHWTLDRDGSESVALVTFASEDEARAFAGSVRGNAERQRALGITLVSAQVVEVTARA